MSAPITSMLIWNGIKIMVTHSPNHFRDIDHIELHAENGQRLQVTETGYFCHESQLEPYGSALTFVQAWQDHESMSREWRAYVESSQQLSLF